MLHVGVVKRHSPTEPFFLLFHQTRRCQDPQPKKKKNFTDRLYQRLIAALGRLKRGHHHRVVVAVIVVAVAQCRKGPPRGAGGEGKEVSFCQ